MAISQTVCTSFKKELLEGIHDFINDSFKIALYTDTATLNADTTVYTADDEVANGNGYTTTGEALTAVIPSSADGIGFAGFTNATWTSSSFTARGALIYNDDKGDRAVMVLDFGDNKTSNNSTFTVAMPASAASTALIRIT